MSSSQTSRNQQPQQQQQQQQQQSQSSTLPQQQQAEDIEADMSVRAGDYIGDRLPPIDYDLDRFPYCIVWTPIPVLTWILPFIGHMGICMSNGVIRDFAGPYLVTEDNMAFGRPTRFLRLHPKNVEGGPYAWDEGVSKASVLYGTRTHNLFCDNCHSHVATALCNMHYKDSSSWNMIILCFWMFVCGRYVGFWAFIKTWLPFLVLLTIVVLLAVYF